MSHCDFDESCLDILIFNNVVLHDVDMRAPRKCTHSTHWGGLPPQPGIQFA